MVHVKVFEPPELLSAKRSMCEFPCLFYNVKSSERPGKVLYKFTPLLSAYVGTIVSPRSYCALAHF